MLTFGFDKSGGFAVVDMETGLLCYAEPACLWAVLARHGEATLIARRMADNPDAIPGLHHQYAGAHKTAGRTGEAD